MQYTVKDLKRIIEKLPDDAKIWLEYPARYGIINGAKIITLGEGSADEADFIECLSLGYDNEFSDLYIYHHY